RPAGPQRGHPLRRHRPPRDLRGRAGLPEATPAGATAPRLARAGSGLLRPTPHQWARRSRGLIACPRPRPSWGSGHRYPSVAWVPARLYRSIPAGRDGVPRAMPALPLLLVDAFTDRPFAGNACAVVLDAGNLSRELMQAIAREMNQSETAFVLGGQGTRFDVRYYTPGEEIPLAGHPTIATTAALADAGRLVPTGSRTEGTFTLRDGPISIAYERDGARPARVVMTQRRPEFRQVLDSAAVAPVFGFVPSQLRADAPVQVVSTGTPQLMIPIASLDALRRARL